MEKEKPKMNELQMNENPELKEKQLSVIEKAKLVEIKTNEDDANAVFFVKGIKGLIKEIKDKKDGNIEKANKLHKSLTAERNALINPLKLAEKTINDKCVAYRMEVRRKIDEENRKKQEQARKEEERQKKILEERAKKAEEKGNTKKAEILKEKKDEVFVPQKSCITQEPNVQGSTMIDHWSAEVVDINKVPDIYIVKTVNLKMLDELAKSSKGTAHVDGIKFVNNPKIRTRREVI
jgi:hypothetical protein